MKNVISLVSGLPNIGRKGTGPRLQTGMSQAIEPIICEGKTDVFVKCDMWIVAKCDKIINYIIFRLKNNKEEEYEKF